MPKNVRDTIIKVVVASFFVGVLLAFFDIDPKELMSDFGETAQAIFGGVADVVEWGVKYVLLGAVVVVPIWLIFFGVGKLRAKKSK